MQPSKNPGDNIGVGCAMGCGMQLALAFFAGMIASMVGSDKVSNFIFLSSAVTQWILLVPLILHQRAAGYTSRVQGIIIAGCLGVLLCSACGAMLYNLKLH
jgi:hypothetical protein